MPQIWMTYEELAGLLDCTMLEARERAHLERLDRKISRDGNKRVKLNLALTGVFIDWLKAIDNTTDRAVSELRHVHGLLKERDEQPDHLASQRSHPRQSS